MGTTSIQDKLIYIAGQHCFHAEARAEGDVAVFIDVVTPDGREICEIAVASSMSTLRDALGY